MADQHQRFIRPVIHQRPSGGSIHSSDEDQHPNEISPLGQRTSTSASDTRQRDRSYFATGRPGPPRSGRENLAPTEDPRTHRRSSAPGRGDTSAAQSSGRGRGGLTVPRPQTRQRAASTGYQYDWNIFGAEAPHCPPDDSSPNSDNYHKQWVPVRKGEPLPSAESLLRKYVPQAVTCPIKDADGTQTGLMDFWSCGDHTVSGHDLRRL